MPRKDWDPLADTLPPRYAYESDDEDETGLVSVGSEVKPDVPVVDITFLPNVQRGKEEEEQGGVLILANGAAGIAWASGANLGERVGQVNVNKRAIGLLFRPLWFKQKGMVIVSEALTRLPVWAMSPYASAVLERWRPSKVILFDAYSTATYISPIPILHHEAPLRYLSTDRTSPSSNFPLSLFAPPNLFQSTTAAFLNLLVLPQSSVKSQKSSTGLAILAPSTRAPLPSPRKLSREEDDDVAEENRSAISTTFASLAGTEDWDPALLSKIHQALLESAGIAGSSDEWKDTRTARKGSASPKSGRRRRVTETDGGMYI